MAERSVHLNVRMTPEERDMLKELAEDRGLTGSDVIRQFIREAHKRLRLSNAKDS